MIENVECVVAMAFSRYRDNFTFGVYPTTSRGSLICAGTKRPAAGPLRSGDVRGWHGVASSSRARSSGAAAWQRVGPLVASAAPVGHRMTLVVVGRTMSAVAMGMAC